MVESKKISKMLKVVKEENIRYYISCDDCVMVLWNGKWVDFEETSLKRRL